MIEINGIKMYDSEEVTALFNVTRPTLQRLRRDGLITSVNIGRKKYTSEEMIRDYLNGKTQKRLNKEK